MIKHRTNMDTICYFFQIHKETVHHLFWSCFYTEQLWEKIDTFIKGNNNKSGLLLQHGLNIS